MQDWSYIERCSRCGAGNPRDPEVCIRCGSPMRQMRPEDEPRDESPEADAVAVRVNVDSASKIKETIQRIHEKTGIPVPAIEAALRDARGEWNLAMAFLESKPFLTQQEEAKPLSVWQRFLYSFCVLIMPIAVYWPVKLAAWLLLRANLAVSMYPTPPLSLARILQTPFDFIQAGAMAICQTDNPFEAISGGSTVLAILATVVAPFFALATLLAIWDGLPKDNNSKERRNV